MHKHFENRLKIEKVLPKYRSTESITHNSAKLRNVFCDVADQVFRTIMSNSRRES